MFPGTASQHARALGLWRGGHTRSSLAGGCTRGVARARRTQQWDPGVCSRSREVTRTGCRAGPVARPHQGPAVTCAPFTGGQAAGTSGCGLSGLGYVHAGPRGPACLPGPAAPPGLPRDQAMVPEPPGLPLRAVRPLRLPCPSGHPLPLWARALRGPRPLRRPCSDPRVALCSGAALSTPLGCCLGVLGSVPGLCPVQPRPDSHKRPQAWVAPGSLSRLAPGPATQARQHPVSSGDRAPGRQSWPVLAIVPGTQRGQHTAGAQEVREAASAG